MRIILASQSPRRKKLLSELYRDFEIITAECEENLGNDSPICGVERLAKEKGRAVLDLLLKEESFNAKDCMIISSDTLVEYNGIPLGKPKNEDDAFRILTALSGKTHNVHTGVAVHLGGKVYSGVRTTAVEFFPLTEADIKNYISTGEPMDKAGAYGIQGLGGKFVKEIHGEYDNVVGLSLSLLQELVSKAQENNQ